VVQTDVAGCWGDGLDDQRRTEIFTPGAKGFEVWLYGISDSEGFVEVFGFEVGRKKKLQ
jgi:hypothetical protein